MRKRSRPTTKADETPEFQAFWAVWQPYMNQNDGRGSARDEFFRHVEEYGADPQDIVDGAKWFIRSGGQQTKGPDGRPIRLHAQTWLNRRAYEDFAEKERSHQISEAQVPVRQNVVPFVPGQTAFLKEFNARKSGA